VKAIINKREIKVEPQKEKNNFLINNQLVEGEIVKIKNGQFHILQNNKSYNAHLIESDFTSKAFVIRINNTNYHVQLKDKYDDLLHALGMDANTQPKVNNLKAPMPGLVLDVLISEGQQINKGDSMIILEAMKMENVLKAAVDAVVGRVHVSKGARVEKNEMLVELQ
jgi:acetyl/propionyl-CoA carboxylase alpha subunit